MDIFFIKHKFQEYQEYPDKYIIMEKAYLQMLPEGRSLNFKDVSNPVKSAVLVLLVQQNENLVLLFIQRTEDNRVHSGQIAFPGGRFDAEAGDITLADTALRETFEEIGIRKECIEVIGQISELYIPPSNFVVQPFVGYIQEQPIYHLNHTEVQRIIEIPINVLMSKDIITLQKFKTYKGDIEAPCFKYSDVFIWGATAMILNELLWILKK